MPATPTPPDLGRRRAAPDVGAPPTLDAHTADVTPGVPGPRDAGPRDAGPRDAGPREALTRDALSRGAVTRDPLPADAVTGDLAALIPDVRHPSVRAAADVEVLPTLAALADAAPTADAAGPDTHTRDAGPSAAAAAAAAPMARVAAALAGRYELVRPIGRGGMATVYLARDAKHGREVALKLLHPELGASVGGARFLREIRLAAALQHPHVLGLFDSGEADGLLYYVMPYVPGESLRDRLAREGQLPLGEALGIAREVADALAYAHAQGVVHRDVKPENILLANGHAVVADFGIARALSSAGADRVTETGMAVGTPQYMSPEQGTGAADVGPASDVYAAGCVLYEMLVGEPPYTGPNALAIIARHAMAEVPSVRVVRASAPQSVEVLVARALAKTPADRWPSAHAFADAIAAAAAQVATGDLALGGAATGDVPARRGGGGRGGGGGGGTATGAWWPADARRRATLGALALLVAAGSALGAREVQRRRAEAAALAAGPDARRLAVRYFDVAGDAAGDAALRPVADGLTESLAATLARVPGLEVTSAGGTLPYRDGAVTNDSVARALGVGTLVTGRVEAEGAGRVRLTVTLRDASGAPFADSTVVRPAGDLLKLRDDVVDQAAALVRRRLGEAVAVRASLAGTQDAQAWALVQQGLAAGKRAAAAAKTGDAAGTAAADSAAFAAFAAAATRDPRWPAPVLEQARLAYQQSRRRGNDPAYAGPYVARAVALADQAVALDTASASALGARGTALYWQWLLRVGAPDEAARDRNVARAAADLERATRLDPTQAEAWSTLSHYYYQTRTATDAKLAALRAYQADPYLSGTDALLFRLYSTSYDLEQFDDARRYCGEIGRRFPASVRGSECRLWQLTTADASGATPVAARELAAAWTAAAPPAQRAIIQVNGEVAVAAVLARAGQADSARQMLAAALARPEGRRPDLAPRIAWVYTLVGDAPEAVRQLKRFVSQEATTAAQQRNTMAAHWWWRSLQSDPQYQALFASA